MKLAKLTDVWPPRPAEDPFSSVRSELNDIVTGAETLLAAKYHIRLSVQKTDGAEYVVFLPLPSQYLKSAVDVINRHRRASLREVGELEVE